MTDKELIKQEIERLKHNTPNAYDLSRFMLLEEIESFIDSLPEESDCEVNFTTKNEDLEEAATKWDETASFQPFYMQLDSNGNPCEVKQDITTHKESFKADSEWQKQKDEELFSKDTWTYIEENYPNITEEEKLRLYDISIKSRLAGAETFKKHMKETLQTEYEKGRFDMREEMMKDAVEAEVFIDYNINFGYGSLTANIDLDEQHLKEGDKVKIIIVKEEQQ